MYFEILSAGHEVRPQSKRAIVTLALGASYLARWRAVVQPRFAAYAESQGYDAILIATHLDGSWRALKRSAAWQKCLILSQPWSAAYERIGWIDADCVPRPDAPDLFDGIPEGKIGATFVYSQLSDADIEVQIERAYRVRAPNGAARIAHLAIQNEGYRSDGLTDPPEDMVHTGVLALAPAHHRELLEAAYARESQNRWYEQTALSYFALKAGLISPFSPRFNWLLDSVMAMDAPHLTPEAAGEALAAGDPFLTGYIRAQWNRCHFLHLGEVVWRALGDGRGASVAGLDAALSLFPSMVRV